MDTKYYIPIKSKKIYVNDTTFAEYNKIRSKQAYSNNKYRNHTLPISESDQYAFLSNAEDEAINNIEITELHNAIKKLNDSEIAIIDMYFYKGMSEREIAQIMNISQTAIHKRKNTILKKIKLLLQE